MAELTITAGNMLPQTASAGFVTNSNYELAATITQGKLVYIDSSGTLSLASNGAAGTDEIFGIAITAGVDGQPATIQTGGQISFGAILTIGWPYVLGATAGSIMPIGDAVATGTVYSSMFGIAITTSILQIGILNSGVEYGSDIT